MNHGISLKAVSELHGRCWGVLPPRAGRGLYGGQIKGWAGGGGGVGEWCGDTYSYLDGAQLCKADEGLAGGERLREHARWECTKSYIPPDVILAELWEDNPYKTKPQMQFILMKNPYGI